jgi:purine-cytosine permease-like protein
MDMLPLISFITISGGLAILTLIYGHHRWLKRVIVVFLVTLTLLFLTASWPPQHLNAAGCDGNALKGLRCPEWRLLTWLAVGHQLTHLLLQLFGLFILPLFTLSSLLISLYERFDVRRR